MRLLAILPLVLLLSVATACAQKAQTKTTAKTTKQKVKTTKPAKKTAAQAQAAPVLVYKKTPCYGPCPDYEATIYPDGRVTYMGRSNVKMVGSHELKLPTATVQKMLADAQALGFGQLRERYTKNSTDLPSTFLSVRQPDGTLKTVQVEEAAPAALQALLDYISQELDKVAGNVAPAGQ